MLSGYMRAGMMGGRPIVTVSSAGTIAIMRAIYGPRDGDVVEVCGGTSPHDGGGGTFFFDTTQIVDATVSSADITDATHGPTGPIVVTATRHPFLDGQVVEIAGVRGNTDANGTWPIKHLSKDTFALLGSKSNASYTGGGAAASVTVRTSAAHGLAPGGRAVIVRVKGLALNGTYLPIGTTDPEVFTVGATPDGHYTSGGAVGDGGLSFPSDPPPPPVPPVPPPAPHDDGRWVRRRDDTELNVRWFGAVGKGKTDDTEHLVATIRAARTAKAGVYLPAGNFHTTREIRLESMGITGYDDLGLSIRGEGTEGLEYGGTWITADVVGTRSILSIHSHRVSLTGITFNCADHADHGLYLQGASTLRLDEVLVRRALKDAYRLVGTNDPGGATINDNVYARRLSTDQCGTMYCSPSLNGNFPNLREIVPVAGTVSCTAGDLTITGTDFTGIPARDGDFILIGDPESATCQRLEIAEVGPTTITVHALLPPSHTLTGQPFAIGVGGGWHEETHNDNSRVRMDVGKIRYTAGSGVVCRGAYGPMIDNMELQGCGFAGIVIGTLKNAPADQPAVFFSTRIASAYFEGHFPGGCVFLAQARGITIDQPMWFGQRHRLIICPQMSATSGILGQVADFTGLHAVGASSTTDIPTSRGTNLVTEGTLTLPSAGHGVPVDRSPWTKQLPIDVRNVNIHMNHHDLDASVDVTATPPFPPGQEGQEIALCNVTNHAVTLHDNRNSTDATRTRVALDCEPGGTVSLAPRQIMVLHFSMSEFTTNMWVQRGAVAAAAPHLESLTPTTIAATGDTVTITGTNLANATSVELSDSILAGGFGDRDGTIDPRKNTATSLTFTVPKRRPGTHTVLVMTPHGASNLLSITMI